MKKLLTALAILVSLSVSAQKDTTLPKNITITLSPQAWDVILKGLQELPLKESGGIFQEILIQAQAQLPKKK